MSIIVDGIRICMTIDNIVLKRTCPNCNKELKYKNKYNFLRAKYKNSKCSLCQNRKAPLNLIRKCPSCNLNIKYSSYDEKYHEYPKFKLRDKLRQTEIIKKLNCKFYRYNETKNKFYEVLLKNGKTILREMENLV